MLLTDRTSVSGLIKLRLLTDGISVQINAIELSIKEKKEKRIEKKE